MAWVVRAVFANPSIRTNSILSARCIDLFMGFFYVTAIIFFYCSSSNCLFPRMS